MRPLPCSRATIVTNTHLTLSLSPVSRKASQWLDEETAYWACQAPMPQFLTIVWVFPSLFPRALLWNSSLVGTPEVTNLKGVLPSHRLTKNNWDRAKSTERKIRPWPMRPPRHSTAIAETKSRDKSLSKHLRLAHSSYPEEFFMVCRSGVPCLRPET